MLLCGDVRTGHYYALTAESTHHNVCVTDVSQCGNIRGQVSHWRVHTLQRMCHQFKFYFIQHIISIYISAHKKRQCCVWSGRSLTSLVFNHRLDDQMNVQVADFGLSRDIYERDYYSSDHKKTKLPVKWMALDSLEKATYNEKTDVVSAHLRAYLV